MCIASSKRAAIFAATKSTAPTSSKTSGSTGWSPSEGRLRNRETSSSRYQRRGVLQIGIRLPSRQYSHRHTCRVHRGCNLGYKLRRRGREWARDRRGVERGRGRPGGVSCVSARRICNAALPLRPLIHKTLLPTPIIPPFVCVLVYARLCWTCPRARAGGATRGGIALERLLCTCLPVSSNALPSETVFVNKLTDRKSVV